MFNEILPRLSSQFADIELIIRLPGGSYSDIDSANIRTIKDWNLKPRRFLSKLSRSVGDIRSRALKAQVFHSTYYSDSSGSIPKTVVNAYDFVHERYPAMYDISRTLAKKKKEQLEKANAVVAISQSTRADILSYTDTDESKISVIYPGVSSVFLEPLDELAFASISKQYALNRPYWLFVGQRGHYKNFGTVLRAFAQVAPSMEIDLAVVGGGTEIDPWHWDYLIKNKLERRLHLLSRLDDRSLCAVYKKAAGFIFPSLLEGFGIPIVEAMACETPVIASDIPVFHELAEEAALYFDPHSQDALADAMLQVLDSNTRLRLVSSGRERVPLFSWDIAATKLGHIYQRLGSL